MKNLELECLPNWRYCRIPYATKGPRDAGWQNNPLELTQVPDDMNIGVLLGPASGGIAALDFDGPLAWDWWDANIGIAIPDTVTWTSGKPGRCQMAFYVEDIFWEHLATKKVDVGEGQGFEFRWTGGQSVLPPSQHPDTQQPYFWLRAPTEVNIAPVPDEVLRAWLKYTPAEREATELVEQGSIDTITDSDYQTLVQALDIIKQNQPTLDYDSWLRTAFAVAQTVGNRAAKELMQERWPEESAGEYARMLNSRNPARSPGLGSLIHRARQSNPEFKKSQKFNKEDHQQRVSQFNQDMAVYKEIKEILKEIDNERRQ